MRFPITATVAALVLGGSTAASRAAEPPKLRDLRTQTVGGVTYFHARFDRPDDLWAPRDSVNDSVRRSAAVLPRLVPQDEQTRDVVVRVDLVARGSSRWDLSLPTPAGAFEFMGRTTGTGRATFLLLYTATERAEGGDRPRPVETTVELDFANANVLPPATDVRRPDTAPASDDLQGLWAAAQIARFAALETLAPEFSYYGFARSAVGRLYVVPARAFQDRRSVSGQDQYRRAYETTTGAAAITESLQLERMLDRSSRDDGPREIDIAKVPGIDIAEHPWGKMMAGQTPDPEPLARLIPHDNWYLHCKTFAKYVEMGDFVTDWGTVASRAADVRGRDDRVKERYEKQLCLKTTLLGRTLGPFLIRGVALTGSDPYFREGTDLAVIFHVNDAKLFRSGVEPFLQAARQEFGDRLKAATEVYHDVTIDSFVTPRREVSLYRAGFDEFQVYANSPIGMRRILDARAGRIKPMADGGDFRYMRTAFRHSDAAEDGFVFLSDPFIKQLVGPASKIKEKRRLEGLTGLTMATNAALYHAWETGKPPADLAASLRVSGLKEGELHTLDQPTVAWDAVKQVAVSPRYNTLHFATPLVELPIDRVTRREQTEYDQFRRQYLGLWRQYSDPVGLRFKIDGDQVRFETYILPLIQSSQYNELRRQSAGAGVSPAVSPPTEKTVAQILGYLSPTAPVREDVDRFAGGLGAGKVLPWLGDWWVLRFDDSPVYGRLYDLSQRNGSYFGGNSNEWLGLVFRMPVTFGVEVREPLAFAGFITALRTAALNALPNGLTWEPMEPDYRGTKIVRVQMTRQGIPQGLRAEPPPGQEPFLPALYYALVDGAWYVSLQEQPIRDMIDRSIARREKPAAQPEEPKVNSAIYASPAAATETMRMIRAYLEDSTHRQALANAPVWYAFERSGLLAGKDAAGREAVLRNYLGHLPVSPEGAAYRYDPRTDEVVNARHGSPRMPTPQKGIDPDSPLGKLLAEFRSVSADLRFREDGIHTTVTLRKK